MCVVQDVDAEEMSCFIGIMFAMVVSPCANVKDYRAREAQGVQPAFNFEAILRMSYACFYQIRSIFALSPNIVTTRTF